jgi:hypothetical protein
LRTKTFDASAIEPPQRMLHGVGCDLFSIAIGADRIVSAGEDGSVRIWNFSEALEIERRAQAGSKEFEAGEPYEAEEGTGRDECKWQKA